MIICKIKTNEETKVVSLEEYSLYSVNNEVVFPTETILRNNGYINGHFQLTYYLLSNWKDLKTTIYDSKLIPISFSKNKTQIRAKFENYPELTNDEDIYQFQNYYQANKTKIKLLSFSKNKVAVVQHLKYNFFKGYYVIRFSQKVDYTTQDKFSLYTMKFQPIVEE